MNMFMNKMKILVVGGAGFIGSHVVDLLVEKGHEAYVLDNLSSGKKENINDKAKFFEIDLGEYDKLKEIFSRERFDIVYHLAAQIDIRKSVDDPVFDAKINILDSLNLIECCVRNNVKHFVFSSSGGAIYGDDAEIPTSEDAEERPVSAYGCAKLALEKYLHFYNKVYGLKYSCLRYSNVYGPRQNSKGEAGVIAIFFDNMLNRRKPIIFGGTQTRDFVYVGDIARANVLVLDDMGSEIYNVGTGKEIDIIELFSKMNGFFGNKFEAEFRERKKGEQLKSCLSFEKIGRNFGWMPEIELDEGLKRTYEWFFGKFKKS